MKKYIYFVAVVMTFLFGITCLSSCQNDEENVDVVKNIIMEVDSHPCEVYPFGWDITTPIPGMKIKEENSKNGKMNLSPQLTDSHLNQVTSIL